MKLYQCRLTQPSQTRENCLVVITAYIEDRGACVGSMVELKGEEGLWKVEMADREHPIEMLELREKQRKDSHQREGSDI